MTGERQRTSRALRTLVAAGGLSTSMSFVIVGLASQLQMYGDGALFSYAVAAQDAWAFHWHDISGRLFTYLFACPPAGGGKAATLLILSRTGHSF